MLNFALNYSDILKRNNDQLRIAQNDFHEKLKSVTGAALIETFVELRKTGNEHPGRKKISIESTISMSRILVALQFEEAENFKGNFPSTHSSSVTPDLTQGFSDELINLDASDFPVPNFQTHFPVATSSISSAWPSTTSIKKSDSNRGKNYFRKTMRILSFFLFCISCLRLVNDPMKTRHSLSLFSSVTHQTLIRHSSFTFLFLFLL